MLLLGVLAPLAAGTTVNATVTEQQEFVVLEATLPTDVPPANISVAATFCDPRCTAVTVDSVSYRQTVDGLGEQLTLYLVPPERGEGVLNASITAGDREFNAVQDVFLTNSYGSDTADTTADTPSVTGQAVADGSRLGLILLAAASVVLSIRALYRHRDRGQVPDAVRQIKRRVQQQD